MAMVTVIHFVRKGSPYFSTSDNLITWQHAPTKWFELRKKDTLITEKETAEKKDPGVRWEHGIVNSTIQNIWKNRMKMINAFEQNGSRIKRFRKTEETLMSGLSNSEMTVSQ